MAGQSVGQVQLDLLLNSSAFKSQLQGAVNKAVSQTSSGISSKVGSTFSKLGKLAIAAFSVKAIAGFASSAIELGSTLQEVQNVVDSTFTTMSEDVNAFAKTTIKQFGLSEAVTKKYVGTMGAMAKSFGFTEQEAFNMSTTLTGLVGDVASFYNLSSDEAYTKLKAVFTGETEALKELGVVMTQAALDEFALAKGYGKTTKAMSEQEKVALRYAFVQNQLSTATGDFIRTSKGWANQTRVLGLQWESLKANLGQAFISVLTPVIQMLNLLVEKLVAASAAFKSFVEGIFGAQEAAGGGSTSTLVEDTANLESGLTGATGAAKKLKKSLMGFDNLNVLPDNSDAAAGTGSASMPTMSPVDTNATGAIGEVEKKTSGLIERLKELAHIAKTGFLDGLGGQNTEQITSNLGSISTGLQEIATNAQVVGSAKSFVDSIVLSLGTAVGAVGSMGITLGNLVTGSIKKVIQDRKEAIQRDLVDTFNIGEEISAIYAKWSKEFANIFSVFGGENATGFVGNVLKTLYDLGAGITKIGMRISRDFAQLITLPIANNSEEIKTSLDGLLGNFNTVWSSISKVVGEKVGEIVAMYDENIKPFFDSLSEGLSEIVNTFFTLWNTHMQPVLDQIAKKVSEIWEEHLSPVIGKVIEIVGKVIEIVKLLWENFLQPIVKWIIEKLVPLIAGALKNLWNDVSVVITAIIDIVGGILKVLGGLIDFIVGVFTGDWKRAWNGIKDIFGGIWDALVAIIKVPINLIINMLNRMIEGINKLDFTMPEWVPIVGGKSLGFEIPKIPQLAEGGYVKPDAPQLAVIGDNRHHGEIVAPENKLHEAVAANVKPVLTAIQQLMSVLVAQGQNGGGDITIPIYLDGTLLEDFVVTAQDRKALRSGGLA